MAMDAIKAISLDLDDTLWPIWPIIERAEQRLHDFLEVHAPATARQFPIPAMRTVREHIAQAHPELAHDFTAQRKLSLQHAFHLSGVGDELIEPAFDAFFQARNNVEFYDDCLPALERLSRRFPLLGLTNGNADLDRTGIGHFFVGCVSAKSVGSAKPHGPIFEAACQQLQLQPSQILHVGDDPWLDVQGAHSAGLHSAWINRNSAVWPEELQCATVSVTTLAELADYLDTLFA